MVVAALKRYAVWALTALGALLGVASLVLLARSVENSTQFGRWQPWILLLNLIGVLFLAVVLTRKIWQLARDFRAHVPGSRLTARTVTVFGVLVIAPLLVVYLFSLEFLNRGIDSWFRVEVKQGLGDALVLSRAALDLRMREQGRRTEDFARTLAIDGVILPAALDAERRRTGALEIIVFGRNGEVLAASSAGTDETLHARPPTELLLQIRENRPYVSLEPASSGGYVISTAAPLPEAGRMGTRFVLAMYDVPPQLAALSEAVQTTYSQYGDLATLREPLKNSFRLTLTLVLLLTMLVAIYLAIYSAQRLTRPVQDLIAGTRAVGKGDFATRLPLPSRDEMGFLVHSFNDMTKRLRRAREEAERSQQIVEQQRQRLAVILARLSTGVMVVDELLGVRIANEAASSILGADLAAAVGRHLPEVAQGNERLTHFIAALAGRLREHRSEWREQIALPPDRVIACACTPLAEEAEEAGETGYVIVFDDITLLLQAQRDAAWGEVARRLAHEIKNPLTPIQLAAERLQRRLAGKLPSEDGDLLARSTDTIVQQVEGLKQMVNAFSEYARAPELKLTDFDLNALVREVTELYRGQDPAIEIRVQADPSLTKIHADRGRLRQVLNNLVTNGIEAVGGPDGGWVEVATTLATGAPVPQAIITVSDNGHGFQKDMLARVFDPYVTSKQKGTGLGLAIVKKITEEHGGRIEADNRPEGGARVRVVLPVVGRLLAAPPQRDIA